MTRERAQQVYDAQKAFPYWGNFQRFMTDDEVQYVRHLFQTIPGNPTFGTIVIRIAQGETFS